MMQLETACYFSQLIIKSIKCQKVETMFTTSQSQKWSTSSIMICLTDIWKNDKQKQHILTIDVFHIFVWKN